MKRISLACLSIALALLTLWLVSNISTATPSPPGNPSSAQFAPISRDHGSSLDQGGETCTNATTILNLPYCDEGTTYWYTDNYTPPCGPSGGRDVVYRYHNLLTQTVTFSLCGSYFNTILHIWRGCPDAGGTLICCNDNTSCAPYGTASCCQSISLPVLPTGQYYYIIVDGAGAAQAGHYILNVFASTSVCYDAHCQGTPPPNDLCANPTVLTNPGMAAQWVNGWTIGAAMDTTPVCNGINQVAPGVWYEITGDGSTFTVTTCDPVTDYDTRISVFCGSCSNLFCVTANDNFNIATCGPTSQVQWCTELGRDYYVLVHGATPIEVGHFRLGYWTDGTACSSPPVCTTVPPNDSCANAILLTTPGNPYSVMGTTVGATIDHNVPCCLTMPTAPGVWYKIIGNGTTLTFSTCDQWMGANPWDTRLSVFCGSCTNLVCVDGNDNDASCQWPGGMSTVSWCSTAGETYYVLVHGAGNAAGPFSMSVLSNDQTCTPVACGISSPPPNDQCSSAIVLDPATVTPHSIRGSTIGASQDNAPFCIIPDNGSGVWYKLPGDGHRVWMTTCNEYTQCTGYDTRLSVYCGTCTALSCVTGNDDLDPCPPMSEVIWCTQPGYDYYILVHGPAGTVNNFQLDWWEDATTCSDYPVCAATGDSCADAIPIVSLPYCDESTTWWSVDNYTPPCGQAGGRDRVYKIRLTYTEQVNVSLCGSYFDTILHIYLGCPDAGGQLLCCSDNVTCAVNGTQSCCQNLTLMGYTDYYVVVDGAGANAAGHYILNVTPTGICAAAHCTGNPPPNDLCANATLLPNPGAAQWVNGWTIGATLDTTPVCNNIPQVAPGVWYRIIGNGRTYTVTTCDHYTDFDTRLSVFCASCTTLVCATANDNFNIPVCGQTSEVQWCTESGREYLILVHGAQAYEVGRFKLGYWADDEACSGAPNCTPVPPNDLCVNAQQIPAPGNGYCVMGTTVGATNDNAPCCLGTQSAPGVWYKLTGNGTAITATTCNAFTSGQNWDTRLSVFCGLCTALICVDGNDNYAACPWPGGLSQVTWCAAPGVEYYILVHGAGAQTGIFSLDMSSDNQSCTPDLVCEPPACPLNDLCANAIPLAAANLVPQHVRGSTINANADNAPFCTVAVEAPGVWYTLTGNGHRVTMTTCNEFTECMGFDTRLSVYCGGCRNLSCITGNDNWPECGPMSEVSWCTEIGLDYYILVHGAAGTTGRFQLDWWDNDEPCYDAPLCMASGDSCEDAILINRIPYCHEATTWWATDNYTPPCAQMFGGRDRVYKLRLPFTEQVTVSLCGSYFDTVLHVWLGCPNAGGALICCNDNSQCPVNGTQSCCTNVVLMGNTDYYIIVDGNGPSAGHYILNVAQTAQCPPAHCAGLLPPNDTCSAAILLPSPADTGQWRAGWTIGATLDNAPVCQGDTQVAPGVWYKIVGSGTVMTVTTCDPYTDFDTKLSVYSGTCDSLHCVTANDNFNIAVCGMTSKVQWCANVNETYFILVHGAFAYEVGHFRIGYWHDDVSCNVAPDSVVIQPIPRDSTGVVNRVRLYWPPVPYAAAYCIYRDTTVYINLVPANLIGSTADTCYTDSLPAGGRYIYAVRTSVP